MNNRTEMMLPPTLEECLHEATKLTPPLPVSEAQLFFYHYSSVGWKVGKLPMKNFAMAMAGWHVKWKQRKGLTDEPPRLSGADKVLKREEYNRVTERIKSLYNRYDSHVDMRAADAEELRKLKVRRDQLRKELGIMI